MVSSYQYSQLSFAHQMEASNQTITKELHIFRHNSALKSFQPLYFPLISASSTDRSPPLCETKPPDFLRAIQHTNMSPNPAPLQHQFFST